MKPGRLEAFTDGVVAIAITIMVLELKVPGAPTLAALSAEAPLFLTYVLSYINVGIFWNNHHHMFQATEHIDGRVLWSNLALLFFISLVPFVIRWIDESNFAPMAIAAYGVVLFGAAVAYAMTQSAIIACNGPDSAVAHAVGTDLKGKLSLLIYAAGAAFAFVSPYISAALYVSVSAMWFIPDRRIERELHRNAR